jgi:uncharacterized protein (TIGR02246 family)
MTQRPAKRRTLLAAAVLTPLVAFVLAAGTPDRAGDDTALVQKNAKDFEAAWNKHDVKALAGIWAKDGDLIDPWGVHSRGREEVEKFFTGEHTGAGQLAKSTYNLRKDSTRFITPDVALSDWDVVITGLSGSDGTAMGPMFHRVVVISKKEGNDWKVAAARPGLPHVEGQKGTTTPATPAYTSPAPPKSPPK